MKTKMEEVGEKKELLIKAKIVVDYDLGKQKPIIKGVSGYYLYDRTSKEHGIFTDEHCIVEKDGSKPQRWFEIYEMLEDIKT